MKKITIHSTNQGDSLAYISGSGNYSTLHLKSGKREMYSMTLLRYEKALPNFLRVHKRFLVNPDVIKKIHSQQQLIETKSGELIPISRRRYPQILDQYQQYKNNN